MKLSELAARDYMISCHCLPDISPAGIQHYGLWMYCQKTNSFDSYLMTYADLKTLHDNAQQLVAALSKHFTENYEHE